MSPTATNSYAVAPVEKKYDCFISYCKRVAGTEDRANWLHEAVSTAGCASTDCRDPLRLAPSLISC